MKTQHARELVTDAVEWYLNIEGVGDTSARSLTQRAAVSALLTVALYGTVGALGLLGVLWLVNGIHTLVCVMNAVVAWRLVQRTDRFRADGAEPGESG